MAVIGHGPMSINAKLIILIVAFIITPLALTGVASFYTSKQSLEQARIHQLAAITDLKRERIVHFFEDIKDATHIAQDYYNIRANLPIVARHADDRTHPDYLKAKELLDQQLLTWFHTKAELADLMLIDLQGRIVYSVNPEHGHMTLGRHLPDPGGQSYSEGLKGIHVTRLFINADEDNRPGIIVSAPIHDLNNQLVGVIAHEINVEALYQILADHTGLGSTGETLIGRKDGTDALFLNPLRHDPDAALKLRIHLGERNGLPMQEAVSGREGEGVAIDYRGVEVVAVWRHMPLLDWGFVAKMDSAEAFAPIIELRDRTISLGLLLALLAIWVAAAIARSIARPIAALEQMAARIGAGDLAGRCEPAGNDEIGRLARRINAMAESLQRREQGLRKLGRAMEQSPASIVITDGDGTIEYVNPKFVEITGYSAQEAIGQNPRLLKSGHQAPEYYAELWRTITAGATWSGEFLNRKKNGDLFWERASISPIFDERHAITHYVAVKEDVTEPKLAELRLQELLRQNRRLTERLFEVQEAERRHLSQELHDQFGQWLTAVQLHAQVIAELAGDQPTKIQASAEAITQCATQMHQVVRGIVHELRPPVLDWGLEAGLHELVSQWRAHRPAIACELLIQCDLERLDEPARITLYRIVQEALTNAAKHARASAVSICLRCDPGEVSSPRDVLTLTIEDDGKGLELTDSTEGMGLTGMRERVLAAGGEFDITSRPGAGTRIEVRLPLAPAAEATA